MDNQAVKNYVAFFNRRQQTGSGDFPVFKGSHVQYGSGFGDVMRGAMRYILPIAAKGIKSFIENTAQNRMEGSDWKSSAANAIIPLAGKVLKKVAKRATKGKRKSNTGAKHYIKEKKRRRSNYSDWNF